MKSRPLALVLMAGAVFASFSSCGGSTTGPTQTTTPTPPPQAVRTVLGDSSFTVRAGGSSFTNVDFPATGTLDVTVDWAGSNNIDIYATESTCPGFTDVDAGRCPILAKGDAASTKPERITFAVVATKIYTLWTANRGSTTENVSMEVGDTTLGPPPTPVAQPTPTPGGPSPSPRASATPSDLAPGPVAQVKAYVKTIDTGGFNYRPGEQDANGNWILHPGEFVVFDMTQRNAAGLICNWLHDPVWRVDDPDGILEPKESSQPFFFRTIIAHKGHIELQGTIDGIDSNILEVESVANGN